MTYKPHPIDLIFLAVLALLGFLGYSLATEEIPRPPSAPVTLVVADTVRNVTCWIRTDAGGIACLPNQWITR